MRRSVRFRVVTLGVLVSLVGATTLLAFVPGADAVEVKHRLAISNSARRGAFGNGFGSDSTLSAAGVRVQRRSPNPSHSEPDSGLEQPPLQLESGVEDRALKIHRERLQVKDDLSVACEPLKASGPVDDAPITERRRRFVKRQVHEGVVHRKHDRTRPIGAREFGVHAVFDRVLRIGSPRMCHSASRRIRCW